MIDERVAQRIKDAANVVDVLRDFLPLQKRGADFVALCPFHDDRHLGSFKVSPRLNRWTCFACDASGNSVDFLMRHQNMSYPDAIRYLGQKYGIYVEGSEKFHPKPCAPHQPTPPLPRIDLPYSYVKARMDTSEDTLCNWIRQLPWDNEQAHRVEQVLKNYLVGHARQGHTIFWQVDEMGFVRTGKMMLYKPDGHRDKETRGGTTWIHAQLARAGKIDTDKLDTTGTLFGMHMLDMTPHATVHIVESEKTALICAIAYGDMKNNVWMASGGKAFLTPDKLAPIMRRERNIILYPDHDAISEWKQHAREMGYKRMTVAEQFVTENWREQDGPKADIADILIRMMDDQRRHRGTQQVGEVVRQMIEENPNLQLLIDKFDLIEK